MSQVCRGLSRSIAPLLVAASLLGVELLAPEARAQETPPSPLDMIAKALAPESQGLTPKQVADRAAKTSPRVGVSRAELNAAAAKVEQAFAAYFPTARVSATYTRYSQVDNALDTGLPAGSGFETITFPQPLNQYAVVASLEVPISDYLLRLTKAYATVTLDVDAKKLEVQAKELDARAEAQIAYFNWIRAKGQAAVALLAVQLAERHLADAESAFEAGYVSSADVARLEAQKAEGAYLVDSAKALVQVSEQQLRTVMHLPPDQPIRIGIDVMGTPPAPLDLTVPALQRIALARRVELKSMKLARNSLREVVSLAESGYYPRLDAFANATYANPNPRVFPQQEEWNFTWDVGVRLSWTINDTFTTIGRAKEAKARVEAVDQQMRALKDGIAVTVSNAYWDETRARAAIVAADARERAVVVALEERRKLFLSGHATATDIVDVEAELTRARLQRVDARIDLRVARLRLEHAVGGEL